MDIAIIGLPQSGKTATFNALTSGHATAEGGSAGPVQVGVVKVVDRRLSVLGQMYHPRKVVYAEIKFWDLPPAPADRAQRNQALSGRHRNILQGADSLLLVVRAFDDDLQGPTNPARDLAEMLNELALADLETLDRAETRFADALKKTRPAERPAIQIQADAVRKVKDALESGIRMRQQDLTVSERAAMTDYQLLTDKPIVVAFNTGESGDSPALSELGLSPEMTDGLGEIQLCARLEEDLALMSDDEAEEFRDALGIAESAIERVKQVCYDTVGLVSFLTVGDDEVRAWPVPDGIPALDAAGTIHTDFTRGFIRAEVIHYNDLVRCGSVAQGRKEGVLRSEGKTYPVKDGDVINFLVNV
jgi:GTP-binding protein YchF